MSGEQALTHQRADLANAILAHIGGGCGFLDEEIATLRSAGRAPESLVMITGSTG